LSNRNTAPSDLAELIQECEAGIATATATAEAEKVKSLDPLQRPGLATALQAAQVAEFAASRLKVLLPRLRAHHEAACAQVYAAKWDADYRFAEGKRTAAATKFKRVPELIAELIGIFS